MSSNLAVVYDVLVAWAASFDPIPEISVKFHPENGLTIDVMWKDGENELHQKRVVSKHNLENLDDWGLECMEQAFLEGFERAFCVWEVGEE